MDSSGSTPYSADVLLMQQIAQRDSAALRTLYERHSPVCFAICLRVLNDRQEAEQVLIDVFAEVWRQADRFDATRGTAAGYLAMMARSRAIDHARTLKKLPTRTLLSTDSEIRDRRTNAQPGMGPQMEEQRVVVKNALGSLSEPQREAVELAFYAGLTHTEIASKLGKPIGSVKTNIRQGLIKMRDALRDYWKAEKSST